MQSHEVGIAVRRVIERIIHAFQDRRFSFAFFRATSRATLNVALVGLLAIVLFTAWVPTASGSLPLVKIWQQQFQKNDRQFERLGNIEVMPVEFEGARLFTLASPTVWDRSQPGTQLPVEVRAKQVEANLHRIIEGGLFQGGKDGILTNFDPKTLQVSIVSLNDVPVVVALDSYHSQPLKLVTVTYIDADYNGQAISALAEQWRSIIYQQLYAALMERSPTALSLQGRLGESLLVLVLMLAASLVLWLLQLPLKRRNRQLRVQQIEIAAEISPDDDALLSNEQSLLQLRENFLRVFHQQLGLQQQRGVIACFRWMLAWGQIAVWIVGITTALALFPWTKQLAPLLATPTVLLLIAFVTSGFNRLASALLQGAAAVWVRFGNSATESPQRDMLRIFSILSAVKPLKTFLIYGIGIIFALVYLGIPLSLLLTVTAIVALAVLLVCQGFIRDWLTGGLILWEDQYAIGDVIAVQNHTALVERMSLRLTQLHDLEGRLISIANGSITQVENLTRGWLQREWRETHPKAHLGPRMVMTSSNGTAFHSVDPTDQTANDH